MILGGVVMTFLVNVLLSAAGHWAVDRLYMADAAVQARNRALSERLERYASEHHVSSMDYAQIREWVDSADADLLIYEGDSVYEVGSWGYEAFPAGEATEENLAEWGYTPFSIDFSNGTCRVAIADCSDLELQDTVRKVSTVASFLVFVGTLLLYTRRISRHLRDCSQDVTAVSRGESEHVNEQRSFTELSVLARDVNHMHDVITDRTRSAQDALQANRELITALSHDIRNPLTSLIGYLDLLGMESDSLSETQRKYLAASAEKADRIRALTDEMFRYFLIFSDVKPPVRLERYDAQILLEQMLGEHAIELESEGFIVRSDALQTPCAIETDITMLHRVLDNIFSNIRKYADPAKPVELAAIVQKERLLVTVRNGVYSTPPHNVESNRVGLRTCGAIMELLNGTFSAGEDHGSFTVTFTFPLAPEAITV